ncbi:MAG: hypothetical protein ACRED5_06160 [Propylenella sp.]
MKFWSRILTGLGSIAIVFGAGGAGAAVNPSDSVPDQSTLGPAVELSEALLDQRGTEGYVQLAARFKDKDDHGRPDLFGPPGPPVIGAPGKSGY